MDWKPIESAPVWKLVIIKDPDAYPTKSCKTVFTAVQTAPGVWPRELASKHVRAPTHWMELPE